MEIIKIYNVFLSVKVPKVFGLLQLHFNKNKDDDIMLFLK